MITPQEITSENLKTGRGYKKKEVDELLEQAQQSYLEVLKENEELKEKASVLSEGVQYYKGLEKTLQKSLVLAEKTSNEIIESAETKARAIEQEAKSKANAMLSDAQKELNQIHNRIISLIQQYEKYRTQCKQFASTQLELLDSSSYDLKIPNMDELISTTTEASLITAGKERKNISFDLKGDSTVPYTDSDHFIPKAKSSLEKVSLPDNRSVASNIVRSDKVNDSRAYVEPSPEVKEIYMNNATADANISKTSATEDVTKRKTDKNTRGQIPPKEPQPELSKQFAKEPQPELSKQFTKEPQPELSKQFTKEPQPELSKQFTKEPQPELSKQFTKELQPELDRAFTKEDKPLIKKTSEDLPKDQIQQTQQPLAESIKKEAEVPDIQRRKEAKDAGFTFSDEEEIPAVKASNTTSSKEQKSLELESDMEINDVLSKLKKIF